MAMMKRAWRDIRHRVLYGHWPLWGPNRYIHTRFVADCRVRNCPGQRLRKAKPDAR